ncbi:hypothetical protein [Candidatus Finniella inopinata]|uniref:Uncharacterized protein n=1 Tax=Candidatus Finniella inopinata TaxID=1696036 RepID=A0A4Q7DJA7_9PROT|nr:hypothetical protein [Candidatus Finniella inopinata]RZI46114.1 hypothetical protein EQU50_04050 [Candidatus Finniella inopinata]
MSLNIMKLLTVGLLLTSSMSFAASGSHVLEEDASSSAGQKHKRIVTRCKVVQLDPSQSLQPLVTATSASSVPSSVGSTVSLLTKTSTLTNNNSTTCIGVGTFSSATGVVSGRIASITEEDDQGGSSASVTSSSSPAPSSSTTALASDVEETNAHTKAPSASEILANGLKEETKLFSLERIQKVSSFTLPHALNLTPYSNTSDPEFNALELLVADSFYDYGKASGTESGSSSGLSPSKRRAQEVIKWLSLEIQKKKDDKKDVDLKMAHRKDGVLSDLKTTSDSLQLKIDNYSLLFKEALFHIDRTDSFVLYTRGAIEDLKKSCFDLEALAKEEKNEADRKKHEDTIVSQKANIQKFQLQIISAEALMHAIYPYHRPWIPIPFTAGFLAYPQSSENSERSDITGFPKLPTSFNITPEMLADNVGDKENHYLKYLKCMLNDDAFKLKAAKQAKRVVFESAPTTAAADSTSTSAATVAAATTAAATLESKEEKKNLEKNKLS